MSGRAERVGQHLEMFCGVSQILAIHLRRFVYYSKIREKFFSNVMFLLFLKRTASTWLSSEEFDESSDIISCYIYMSLD